MRIVQNGFDVAKQIVVGVSNTNKMTSIIINNFYRALLRIEEEEGFAKYTAKTLAVRLVDDLYPEDGYITVDDSPRTNKKHIWIQLGPKTMEAVLESWKEATSEESVAEDQVMPEKSEATIPVAEPVPEPTPAPAEVKEVKVKETKKKMTKEEKEAEKAAKEKEKADAKAAKEKEKADAKAAKEKEKADKKAAPKPKFVGNIEKLNPTQDKLLKKVAADMKVELAADAKTKLVEHLNALDNKDFNAKKLEEHIKEFLTPKVETTSEEMWEIPYKGKNYCVNDKGEVFEENTLDSGEVVSKKVGNVGMAYFAEMEQPKE